MKARIDFVGGWRHAAASKTAGENCGFGGVCGEFSHNAILARLDVSAAESGLAFDLVDDVGEPISTGCLRGWRVFRLSRCAPRFGCPLACYSGRSGPVAGIARIEGNVVIDPGYFIVRWSAVFGVAQRLKGEAPGEVGERLRAAGRVGRSSVGRHPLKG